MLAVDIRPSFAESPEVTVLNWVTSDWVDPSIKKEDLTTRLLSISNETNRTPDSRPYLIQDGVLIDEDTGDPILSHIAPGVEYQIAQELQKRVAETEEGVFIWHSPKLEGVYPCNKTMIYQIVYNEKMQKVLLYSAILYDGEIPKPEEQRGVLISAPDEDETYFAVLTWIESVSHKKPEVLQPTNRSNAEYFAEKIRAGIAPELVVQEMQTSGFLGENPISCPVGMKTFANLSTSGARLLIYSPASGEKKYVKNCGNCGASINGYMSAGDHCPKCDGVYEGC